MSQSAYQTKTSLFKKFENITEEMQEMQNDFDVPNHLIDRFKHLELTIKQGVVTPRIRDLMSEEMCHQDAYRLAKTVGHLEKLLNDSNLSNADTERLDPESLYKHAQIAHKT